MKTNKLYWAVTLILIGVLLVLLPAELLAQCSMCRTSLENNVSNGGEANIAAGINKGILYLLIMPYLIIGTVTYLWYRSSRANQAKIQLLYQRLRGIIPQNS